MFSDENHNSTDQGVVLKLKKSLYGIVKNPRSWYHHLQCGQTKIDFVPSAEDPGMYYGQGMILITYVDDTLFFGTYLKQIEKVISKLEGLGYSVTREEGDESTAFAFQGFRITPDPITKMLRLTQTGIIEKILKSTGMPDCNTRGSPSISSPLRTDATGAHRKDSCNYTSVIVMMMYLESNSHPEIQFAVHQCAWFTYFPRGSHEEAVKHICRYLQGVKGQGLTFQPTQELQL